MKRRRPPSMGYSPGMHQYKKRKTTKNSTAVLHEFLQFNMNNKLRDPKALKHLANFLNKLECEYIDNFSRFWQEIQTQPIGDVFHGEKRLEIQDTFQKLQERKDQIKLGGNLIGRLEAIFAQDEQKRNAIKPRMEKSLKERISKEKAIQRIRASSKAPIEKNNANQDDSGMKFWQMFEPLFEFQDGNALHKILQKTLEDCKAYLHVPPFGDLSNGIQKNHVAFEHGPNFGFEEETDTRWETHTPSCPLCERALQPTVMEHRWSCDHFNHIGPNNLPPGQRAYCCPQDRCDINMCQNCYNRTFEQTRRQDAMRSLRLKSASALVMGAFMQPQAMEWNFQEDGSSRTLKIPSAIPPGRLRVGPRPPAKASSVANPFSLEQRMQMELKELGLFESPSDFQPEKREDDEICLFLREKHDILKEQLTRVRMFHQKIEARCQQHSKKAKKLMEFHQAQEDFLRSAKDPTKSEEELLEALEKFEAVEKSVGNFGELVETHWMKNF